MGKVGVMLKEKGKWTIKICCISPLGTLNETQWATLYPHTDKYVFYSTYYSIWIYYEKNKSLFHRDSDMHN
jgi:hypothetical protein